MKMKSKTTLYAVLITGGVLASLVAGGFNIITSFIKNAMDAQDQDKALRSSVISLSTSLQSYEKSSFDNWAAQIDSVLSEVRKSENWPSLIREINGMISRMENNVKKATIESDKIEKATDDVINIIDSDEVKFGPLATVVKTLVNIAVVSLSEYKVQLENTLKRVQVAQEQNIKFEIAKSKVLGEWSNSGDIVKNEILPVVRALFSCVTERLAELEQSKFVNKDKYCAKQQTEWDNVKSKIFK